MSEISDLVGDADPISPPLPIPDVPGGDVGVEGLPARSALSPRQRLVVEASAISDVALRTTASALLAATVAPVVVGSNLRRGDSASERDKLRFYAELGAERDPRLSFPGSAGTAEKGDPARQSARAACRPGHHRQHFVPEQLPGGQPRHAQAVECAVGQQCGAGPTLAP